MAEKVGSRNEERERTLSNWVNGVFIVDIKFKVLNNKPNVRVCVNVAVHTRDKRYYCSNHFLSNFFFNSNFQHKINIL